MKRESKNLKILWAVDPFVEDMSLQKTAAWALRALTKDLKAQIEPVYSLGGYPEGVPFESVEDLVSAVQERAQDGLEDVLRRVKLPGLAPLRVLAGEAHTLRQTVDQLVEYAKRVGAKLIVVSTRARKGPKRWVTGSFAESLMLRSDVPLFVVNPLWQLSGEPSADLKNILFPTDFSSESREAFGQVVRFAGLMGGRITLFHKLAAELNPGLMVAFAANPPLLPAPPDTFDEDLRRKKAEARRWARWAEEAGVPTEVFIDNRLAGSAADAILRFARRHPGLIALAARSGPIASVLLGSTTREVARSSPFPVWIVHTRPRKKEHLERIQELRRRKPSAGIPFTVTERDIMGDLLWHGRKSRRA